MGPHAGRRRGRRDGRLWRLLPPWSAGLPSPPWSQPRVAVVPARGRGRPAGATDGCGDEGVRRCGRL